MVLSFSVMKDSDSEFSHGEAVDPWRCWFICTGSTYGTWLPGDPRGWRTKGHRVHVEGDYRNPPVDTAARKRLHEINKARMKQSAVYLDDPIAREAACEAMALKLVKDDIECSVLSVSINHYHVLVRVPDCHPRYWLGRAKKSATTVMKKKGVTEGRVWASKGQCKPIVDEGHWCKARDYIERHFTGEGAAVWVDGGLRV